jgi:hypothetical protein
VKRAKAEGRQHGFSLAQEIPDLLCLDRLPYMELLHLFAHGDQLLKLLLGQTLFLGSQLLLGRKGVFLEGDGELVVEEVHTCLPQALVLCLHGSLTSTEVSSMGRELAALVFKVADNIFFLLL